MECIKGHNQVVKNGTTKGKQRYYCKICQATFIYNNKLARMYYEAELIKIAFDLFYNGMSLRGIRNYFYYVHNKRINHVTIWKWIMKYSVIARKNVDCYKIKPSKIVMADEMVLVWDKSNHWYWHLMDNDTRFIFSDNLTLTRTLKATVELFRNGRNKMLNNPDVLITDGLKTYEPASRKVFFTRKRLSYPLDITAPIPRTTHINLINFKDRLNNNIIERYNGSIKDFYKIRRGFKKMYSARNIMHGWYVYYNFLRPHEYLNGLTPAQAIGINLDLKNRWLNLIK